MEILNPVHESELHLPVANLPPSTLLPIRPIGHPSLQILLRNAHDFGHHFDAVVLRQTDRLLLLVQLHNVILPSVSLGSAMVLFLQRFAEVFIELQLLLEVVPAEALKRSGLFEVKGLNLTD